MDVYSVFLGECMSSTSMRNPIYRDYEKFPYGTMESSLNSTTRNYYNSVQGNFILLFNIFRIGTKEYMMYTVLINQLINNFNFLFKKKL